MLVFTENHPPALHWICHRQLVGEFHAHTHTCTHVHTHPLTDTPTPTHTDSDGVGLCDGCPAQWTVCSLTSQSPGICSSGVLCGECLQVDSIGLVNPVSLLCWAMCVCVCVFASLCVIAASYC